MLSKTLKELRQRKGITQAELAGILDITQQAVARWERNKSEPDVATLNQLADYFNVSTDYLLGRSLVGHNAYLSKEQADLLSDFEALTSDGKNLLKNLLASLRMSHSQIPSNIVQNNSGGNNFVNVGGGSNFVTTL